MILTVTVLLAGAASLYAFDSKAKHHIADGVTINGVDVGGLTPAQARDKLSAALLKPLDRPVRVRHRGSHYTLTPEAARIAIDIDGSVDRAMAASQEGNLFSRTWREVRGTNLNTRVEAKVSWDRAAVRKLVRRVKAKLTVEPRDASVDLENGNVDPITSKDGQRVELNRLRHDIRTALLNPGPRRVARIHTDVVKPEVTTEDLAKKYPAIIIVNRGAFTLRFYKNLKLHKTYRIAVGQVGLETPAGLYHVQNKAVNPSWHVPTSAWAGSLGGTVVPPGPSNPIKARWMGIFDGAGIHGTSDTGSIGSAASHGCIRMMIPDVIELYDQVPVGAPVYIA
jgi:lipoprotein-anchoring transpeptidase ErfK/SrfK